MVKQKAPHARAVIVLKPGHLQLPIFLEKGATEEPILAYWTPRVWAQDCYWKPIFQWPLGKTQALFILFYHRLYRPVATLKIFSQALRRNKTLSLHHIFTSL